ncbi:TetR family transcriptional regulator [Antrihabitans stalactiti]
MDGSDTRSLLLAAAERMIAEHGIDVPLRDVAAAAGQRNNSAVQYHFGSRDGLIEAIVERRMVALERARLELLAEDEANGASTDPAAFVTMLVAPLLDVPYRDGATHYARFLEQTRRHPAVIDPTRLDTESWVAARIIITRLERSLRHLGPEVRRKRLGSMTTAMFALLADFEGEMSDVDAAGRDVLAREIVDMLVGMLMVPQR